MQIIATLIKKELIQTIRDKRMLFILIISPIIQLVIFGYVATTDIKNVTLVIFDNDRTSISRALSRSFFTSNYFSEVSPEQTSISEPEEFLKTGKAKVAIIIPPDFSEKIARNTTTSLMIIGDGSDANSATIIKNYILEIIRTFSLKIVEERNLMQIQSMSLPKITPSVRIWYNEELKSSHYMVPGIICMILFIITSLLTAMAISRERELGTLEQVLVSPLKRWEFILGKTIPFVFVGFIEVVLILSVAKFLFHIYIRGNLLLLFFTSIIFLFTTLGFGLFAASVSRTQMQAMLTVFPVMMPTFLLSGLFFPISSIPTLVRWIAYVNPMTYFLIIVRGILLKNTGIIDIYKEIMILAVFGIFFLVFSSLRLQKRIE